MTIGDKGWLIVSASLLHSGILSEIPSGIPLGEAGIVGMHPPTHDVIS